MELNLKQGSSGNFSKLLEDVDNNFLYAENKERVKLDECDGGAANTSVSTGLAGAVPENVTNVKKTPKNTKNPPRVLSETDKRIAARKAKNEQLKESISSGNVSSYTKDIKRKSLKEAMPTSIFLQIMYIKDNFEIEFGDVVEIEKGHLFDIPITGSDEELEALHDFINKSPKYKNMSCSPEGSGMVIHISGKLHESEEPEKIKVPQYARRRYKPQKWANGKGDGTDHETGYSGPSDYEKQREEWSKRRVQKNGIDKTTRGEEYFGGPNYNPIGRVNSNVRFDDGQEDAFLAWFDDYFAGKDNGKTNYRGSEELMKESRSRRMREGYDPDFDDPGCDGYVAAAKARDKYVRDFGPKVAKILQRVEANGIEFNTMPHGEVDFFLDSTPLNADDLRDIIISNPGVKPEDIDKIEFDDSEEDVVYVKFPESMLYESNRTNKKRMREGSYQTFTNHIGEKDSFYDPYKKEPSEPDMGKEFDFEVENSNPKGTCATEFGDKSPKEIEDLLYDSYHRLDYLENNLYDVQKEARLSYDWDTVRNYKQKIANEEVKYNKLLDAAVELSIAGEEFSRNSIKKLVGKEVARRSAAQKRAASKEANRGNRTQKYADELRSYYEGMPEKVLSLLDDNGLLKERRSWGVIKDYFDTPFGRCLKNLWVNQFGKK